MAGLQQLSELFLVHFDYSLGSSATKRNAKDEEKEKDKVVWKRFYVSRLEGKKKINIDSPTRQGLFFAPLGRGVVSSFKINGGLGLAPDYDWWKRVIVI